MTTWLFPEQDQGTGVSDPGYSYPKGGTETGITAQRLGSGSGGSLTALTMGRPAGPMGR